MKKFFLFVFSIVVSFLPGIVGAVFSPNGPSDLWYNALIKSSLNPAGWVFGVAWAILYILLGIALFLVITDKEKKNKKTLAYWLFAINIFFNALWSYLFFGLQMIGAGVINVAVLIFISIWLMRSFLKINKTSGYLILPYIIWLFFALYLNGMIYYLN